MSQLETKLKRLSDLEDDIKQENEMLQKVRHETIIKCHSHCHCLWWQCHYHCQLHCQCNGVIVCHRILVQLHCYRFLSVLSMSVPLLLMTSALAVIQKLENNYRDQWSNTTASSQTCSCESAWNCSSDTAMCSQFSSKRKFPSALLLDNKYYLILS